MAKGPFAGRGIASVCRARSGYAAGVRAGKALATAERMEKLWIERGHLLRVFDFDPASVLLGRGLANHTRLLEIQPVPDGSADVALSIVVTTPRPERDPDPTGQRTGRRLRAGLLLAGAQARVRPIRDRSRRSQTRPGRAERPGDNGRGAATSVSPAPV